MNDRDKPNNRTKQQKPVTAQYLENAALYYFSVSPVPRPICGGC